MCHGFFEERVATDRRAHIARDLPELCGDAIDPALARTPASATAASDPELSVTVRPVSVSRFSRCRSVRISDQSRD